MYDLRYDVPYQCFRSTGNVYFILNEKFFQKTDIPKKSIFVVVVMMNVYNFVALVSDENH